MPEHNHAGFALLICETRPCVHEQSQYCRECDVRFCLVCGHEWWPGKTVGEPANG